MAASHRARSFERISIKWFFVTGVVEGTGVIEGTGTAFCKCLFEYISPVLPDMITLLSIYHNYQQISQLILELFRECSHTMLCYFGRVSSLKRFQRFISEFKKVEKFVELKCHVSAGRRASVLRNLFATG